MVHVACKSISIHLMMIFFSDSNIADEFQIILNILLERILYI